MVFKIKLKYIRTTTTTTTTKTNTYYLSLTTTISKQQICMTAKRHPPARATWK